MAKQQKNQLKQQRQWFHPWYFLVIALISAVVSVFALRANYQHMVELRDAVYAADKDNTDIQKPLKELQAYVTTHMNTNLSSGSSIYPPIQLKYTYQRIAFAQGQQFGKNNTQLYSQAQSYCEKQNSVDFSGRNRVPCIEQYVQSHSSLQYPTVPDSLYKFAFVTPKWSPDLAGWSLIVALISIFIFAATFLYRKFVK